MLTHLKKHPALTAAAGFFIAVTGAVAQQGSNPNGNLSPSSGNNSSADQTANKKSGMESKMKASSADSKFAMEAAQGGLEEVELGRIATQKGQSDKVKQFGQRMVDDHGKANDELKSIASTNGITLPTELDAKHKAMVDKFSGMQAGASFDQAYTQAMIKDHQKDIADFQKEANSGSNSDLKSFAAKTLPTLQDHLRQIQEAQSGSK